MATTPFPVGPPGSRTHGAGAHGLAAPPPCWPAFPLARRCRAPRACGCSGCRAPPGSSPPRDSAHRTVLSSARRSRPPSAAPSRAPCQFRHRQVRQLARTGGGLLVSGPQAEREVFGLSGTHKLLPRGSDSGTETGADKREKGRHVPRRDVRPAQSLSRDVLAAPRLANADVGLLAGTSMYRAGALLYLRYTVAVEQSTCRGGSDARRHTRSGATSGSRTGRAKPRHAARAGDAEAVRWMEAEA